MSGGHDRPGPAADEALAYLIDGNERFLSVPEIAEFNRMAGFA